MTSVHRLGVVARIIIQATGIGKWISKRLFPATNPLQFSDIPSRLQDITDIA
jgi:hypothetical protein